MVRTVALTLTVVTGFTGLVYEVAWQKSLALLLGSHGEATAAVLAIFLGGLSLGYAAFGRVSRQRMEAAREGARPPRLLLVYAGVEAAIGLWALAFPPLFAAARSLSIWLPFRHDPAAFVADVGLTALLIGPPTILMGGTIPLLTQALARSMADATRFHARVYAFNTAGAFVGALAAAFALIPTLGIPGTLRAMGALNLFAAAVFAVLSTREHAPSAAATPIASETRRIEGFAVFSAAALLIGFAMMATQTVLIRVGGLSFGASHFTFAMVVAVFVLCIAAGSLAVSAFDRISRSAVVLCPVLLTVSLAALYPLMDHAPWAAHVIRILFRDTEMAFHPYFASAFVGILAVLAIPVGLSGASLPLLFHELRRSHGELGSVAGRLYSWNTVGNLLGALLGGYVLLYWLDLHHVYRIAVAAVAAASGLLALRLYPGPRVTVAVAVGGVAVLACLALAPAWSPDRMSAGFFRTREPTGASLEGPDALLRETQKSVTTLFHDDDPTATITIKESRSSDGKVLTRSIHSNGKSDGSLVGDYLTTSLVGLLPCLIAESCQDVLVIGFGTGVTAGELGTLDSVKQVVVAEISNAVIEAAPLFDMGNQGATRNPKVRFVRGDAQRTLLRSTDRFDVITSEPSNPWVVGTEMLFSREFLTAARERLRPGGVHAQWIHSYEINRATLDLVLRTYRDVFERVSVWFGAGQDLLLLGLMPKAQLDLERIEARMQRPDIAAALRRTKIDELPELLAHELWPVGVAHALDLPGELHTLMHPLLSDRAARAFFLGRSAHLPPSAGVAAAEVGARNSLLRAWIEREGGFTDAARLAYTVELCEENRPECATALAHWRYTDPSSPQLAEIGKRFAKVAPPDRVRRLALLFDTGPQETLNRKQARQWTGQFGSYYHHGFPFERAALDAVWRRCRERDCWLAKEEALAPLGGAHAPNAP